MENERKDVLRVIFCAVVFKITSVHTKRYVTLDTFEYHGLCHAPRWTHMKMLLLGVAARPVLIVTYVQSSDVSRRWGWSPYRHGWSWLMPRPCQHLSDKGEMKWPGRTGRKRAFLSTSMFGGWPCSYWPSYLHYQHAPCDGYNLPQKWYWRPSRRWAWIAVLRGIWFGDSRRVCFTLEISRSIDKNCNATTWWNSKLKWHKSQLLQSSWGKCSFPLPNNRYPAACY